MYVSSRLTTGLVFAVVIAIALWTFGVPTAQAKTPQGSCSTCAQPAPTQSCLTCPEDPKEIRKAEKEAAHAQHEAEEDQARAAKEAAHARHEAAEDCKRQPSCMCCAPVEKETAIVIERVKPQPVPEPSPAVTPMPEPAPVPEPEPVVITPPPAPEPEAPKELPKTASPMGLIGLVGLASMAGYLTQFFRR
jgi:hypothetical protein